MTHYLKNARGILVDADVLGKDDFSVVVDIGLYSRMLLDADESERPDIINDFRDIQELRTAYFEGKHLTKITPDEFLKRELKGYAEQYGLTYVID